MTSDRLDTLGVLLNPRPTPGARVAPERALCVVELIQLPEAVDALQGPCACGGEAEALARGRVHRHLGREHLTGFGGGHDPRRDVDGEARDVVASSKDACKKGGWQQYTDDEGTPFANQGDCVSYVATGGKNKAKG